MGILCGWASIGETGNGRNNKAGDQTGKEVKTGNWYDFGQKAVYRWKNKTYAAKYAKIIKAFCNNDHIGYDMNDRTTLYNLLAKNGWDYTKVRTNVECDCSQLVACGINCTVGKAVVTSGMYTGNLDSQLMKTGLFDKLTAAKYVDSGDYLKIGDIINAPEHHVISALENGVKNKSTSTKKKSITTIAKEVIAGKWGNGDERKKKLKAAGYDPNKVQDKVNEIVAEKSGKKSITTIAKEVIAGKWGNGLTRKSKLKKAGYNPDAIQKKVNEILNK